MSKSSPIVSPVVGLVGAVLAVSTGAILVRWSGAPSSVAAFYRVVFTTVPLLPVAVWRYREAFARMRARDAAFAALSGVALAVHFAAWFESLAWTSVAASVTLVQSQPVFVALGAWGLLHERVTRRTGVGIAVAVSGMVAMSLGDLLGGAFVGLAVGPGLLGHTVLNWALGHLESSVVSVSLLGEPIGATVLAAVLLGELPTRFTVIGGVVVLAGILLTTRARGDR